MTLTTLLELALCGFALLLALYCMTLSRRLRRLNDLETGLGAAIAVMTSEIARLEGAIGRAKTEATAATSNLAHEIERAKSERAYWTLQRDMIQPPQPRPARRRRRHEDAQDA